MTTKAKRIILWTFIALLGLAITASAIDKIFSSANAIKMSSSFGISSTTYSILGIVEILSLALFLYKRTGILGTLLLASYFGGAIATHLQHGQDIVFPMAFQIAIWIIAAIRFPELHNRIIGKIK